MARDDFKNLGFKEDSKPEKKPAEEEGKKGELRW